jgi:short-subunit dehydrogenase
MAISAEKVAQKIYAGITKKSPKERYIVVARKWLVKIILYLAPTSLVDWLFTKPMRKN